ncbi:MAG: hypothetical protein R3B13_31175 [Polyangiaceae bacterium]
MSASARVSVEVEEHGVIRGRGVQTVTWLVKRGDLWCKAAEYPDAVVSQLDAGPGSIWQRRIELTLAVGTPLERVVAHPKADEPRDVLAHLERGRRQARVLTRTRYEVGPRGQIQEPRRR